MITDIENIIGAPLESHIYGRIKDADHCAICGGLPIGQLKDTRFRLICEDCKHTVHYVGKHGIPLNLHVAYWNGRQECIRRARNTINDFR